ncbi:MAG: hypothetical protein J6A21_10215 [Lentisphaeria bacterium]|nr:hypothetical protein [Lentisphaeria bacterium]
MKKTQRKDDLDPNYWVRLNDGRIVSRMHYDRITAPFFKPSHEPSSEEIAERIRKYNEQVLKNHKERGLPLSELKEICGLLVAPYRGK